MIRTVRVGDQLLMLWRRIQGAVEGPPSICPRCGVSWDWDGCACYYAALRHDVERRDMIARLDRWQKAEGRA